MKTLRAIAAACLLSVAIATLGSGCQSWPKDAYIQGAKSTVNAPWGPSTLEAEIIATGTAAKNITIPEIAPKKKP